MRTILALAVLAALAGCGSSKTVHVSEDGEKGVIRRDIDAGQDVAAKSNAARSEGEAAGE